MMRYTRLMALMILLCIGAHLDMSAAEYTTMETISVGKNIGSSLIWQVATSEQKAVKGYPNLPARICFLNGSTSIRQCELGEGVSVISNLEVLRFREKGEPAAGILFKTNTYAMGGGPIYMSLWLFNNKSNHFINILPEHFHVRALGVYRFFSSLEGQSILIVANPTRLVDFDARVEDPKRETIWSPHYYEIEIYRWESGRGFIKAKSYKTARKYDPEGDESTLIDSEMKRIAKQLK
jgi:hypothetical protein